MALQGAIGSAFTNIKTAMSAAGYQPADYRIVYQLPPAPLPAGSTIYWDQDHRRQTRGGCGFFNADIAWLLGTYAHVLKTSMTNAAAYASSRYGMKVSVVDNTNLFDGHRLCQGDQGNAYPTRVNSPTNSPAPGWTSQLEWIRVISLTNAIPYDNSPDRAQEAMHPMYWGQRALAGCNRLAAGAAPSSLFTKYTCVQGAGLPNGQPAVVLAPTS